MVRYVGDAAGFVIEFENGFKLYHAGDTCAFSDMVIIGELYRPDAAMLPIGDFYTMGPREAAIAVWMLGVKYVIPHALRHIPRSNRHSCCAERVFTISWPV